MHKLLNIPTVIWIAQFCYVIVALGVLAFIVSRSPAGSTVRTPLFVSLYVIGMIIVNIAWRLIAAKYIH